MKDLEGGEDAGMSVDKAIDIARGWYPAPGLAGPRYRPAVLLLADEVERLRGELAELHAAGPTVGALLAELALARERLPRLEAIEARAIEWFKDTDLTHPSASEAAIHDAMDEVLDGEPEE